jgi:hypothetical protein
MNRKWIDILNIIHFPLWILKDMMWLLKLGVISFTLSIPAILISIILVFNTKGYQRLENLIISFWLMGNTLWMSHEMFGVNTLPIAIISFIFGIFISMKWIPYKIKKILKKLHKMN